ncbi:hypothetical protein ACFWNK_26960 [Streptomyces sp. NPDC058417]|uniref:hypothetical protein n=1 Tax=unclassified Streptomyces TaxID=2593676 RepID=UPI00364D17DC
MDRPTRRLRPARHQLPPAGTCASGLLRVVPAPAGEPVADPACRTPIYAALVAEWRARGRTVPAPADAPRATGEVGEPRTVGAEGFTRRAAG